MTEPLERTIGWVARRIQETCRIGFKTRIHETCWSGFKTGNMFIIFSGCNNLKIEVSHRRPTGPGSTLFYSSHLTQKPLSSLYKIDSTNMFDRQKNYICE